MGNYVETEAMKRDRRARQDKQESFAAAISHDTVQGALARMGLVGPEVPVRKTKGQAPAEESEVSRLKKARAQAKRNRKHRKSESARIIPPDIRKLIKRHAREFGREVVRGSAE